MINTNLGPCRLGGSKALDPNYCRQPTLWLQDLCPPYSYYKCHVTDKAAVGTTFNVFSYDAVGAKHRTHQNAEQILYILCNRRGLNSSIANNVCS